MTATIYLGYEPRWDLCLDFGQGGERLVAEVLGGGATVETKRDAVAKRTGNLYVECWCWRQGTWHASGFAATQAAWASFVIGEPEFVLTVPTAIVVELASSGRYPSRPMTRGSHPTWGVLVPVRAVLDRLAIP